MDLNSGTGIGSGAVACPVCTLYLREGISLQKHLDTHPKEQVIEALIKASGTSPQTPQTTGPPPPPTLSTTIPQSPPSLQSSQPASQITQSAQVTSQSPYPIGPIFECPPMGTAMMPPQFASFSYQQFVNNGTMMIPQYAMAPPQANQMLQMLYNPYNVYQQQQIPTVQMLSPVTTIPTMNRLQRPMVSVAGSDSSNRAALFSVSENESKQIMSEIVSEPDTESDRVESTVAPASPSSIPSAQDVTSNEHDGPEEVGEQIEYQEETRETSTSSNEAANVRQQVDSTKMPESLVNDLTCIEDEHVESVLTNIEEPRSPSPSRLALSVDPVKSTDNFESQPGSPKFVEAYEDRVEDISKELQDHQVERIETPKENDKDVDVTTSTECKSSPIDSVTTSSRPEAEQLEHFLVTIMETEFADQRKMWKDDSDVVNRCTSQREESVIRDCVPHENCTESASEAIISEVSKVSPLDVELECNDAHFERFYRYKHSISAPTSPVSRKSPLRTYSVHSEFGSNDNLGTYVDGFDGMIIVHDEDEDVEKHENFDEIDMEVEEIGSPHTPPTQYDENVGNHVRSHTPLSAISGISVLRVRNDLSKPSSPASAHSLCPVDCSTELVCSMEDSNDAVDVTMDKNSIDCKNARIQEQESNFGHRPDTQVVSDDFEEKSESIHAYHESVITGHVNSFPVLHSQHEYQSYQQQQQQQQQQSVASHGSDPVPSNKTLLNLAEPVDSITEIESKNFTSGKSIVQQKPSMEILNISEDAHAGPMNVLEFDGLQILVPSTFISESSQKAVSASSQQSAASSESVGIDEEVKSINMRADETMPPRGELSEQESNGCTEQSAWQLYMGQQESSRMSTSYDLMARESWEESEGSDNEIGGPLLDSRSLATHFTSSLFLDRDRKTPTKRTFKCSHCSEVFDCPKERRVHSTTVHKEAGPSGSGDHMDQPEVKDIKLLDGRMNVFEEIFVPGLHHVQQVYQQQQQQSQPLLHQLQPPATAGAHLGKIETDGKMDDLTMPSSIEVACMICNQRFATEKSLQLHHRRMHVTDVPKRIRESAKCQVCSEEFPSVVLFNAHLKIHPLECGQCGKYFYRKQNFKLHMKRHLGIKPFPCTVCDKAFLTKQKLDEHTNGHTGNAPVKCNLCNETFRRYSNLTQHKNRHHLNIKKKLKDYVCHCGEVFHTKKKLAWHKETHDEKPKACTYCNERFIHMASLTRHMRRAHNRRFVPDAQRENENVECPICKCIYLRSSLAVHMRVHNGERPYECQVCSKAFSTKWNLQLHKWTHAARSTKPFKCNQCSAAFYRHSDYTAHMNSHRNVRPYTCNYCGAQFIRKYNCLRHVKEHEENKAYTCDVCNKTFHRSYYLKEHLRVHSGARPYTCHICGKSSGTKSNHNKHVRIHHAREPVNTEN